MPSISDDAILKKVKRIRGILTSDTVEDDAILEIIDNVIKHFKVYVGLKISDEVSDDWDFIISDVVIRQYNRRGSEGMSSESVDGYSVSYEDSENDFKKFDPILKQAFDMPVQGVARKGRIWYY